MKKRLLFLLSAITFFVIGAQLLEENFEYSDGDLIANYGWVPFSGIGVNPVHVCQPGLDFECYTCVSGNAACMTSTGEDYYKFLNNKIISGSVYVSFLVNFQTAQTGDFFFHLGDSVVNNSNKIARVYAKSSGSNFAFGLAKDNENPVYTGGIYTYNTTYLVILKYTIVAGSDNDPISLFVLTECPPFTEPVPTLGPLGVGESDLPNVGKVILQQGANSKAPVLKIDGICLSTTWENGALPVELSSFTSSVNGRNAELNWTTASELNNSGFEIERSETPGKWTKIAFVNGSGTSTSPKSYSFNDRNLNSGRYGYRLKQIDYNGNHEYFNLSNYINIGQPVSFNVSQNYPNPFNPVTKVNYDLPFDGKVTMKVFDISGKEVLSLVNGVQTAGYYSVNINASQFSSGVYFYRVNLDGNSQNFVMTKKMILIK